MTEKRGGEAASKPVEDTRPSQDAAQGSKITQLIVIQLKVQPGKPDQTELHAEVATGGSPYLAADEFWWRRAPSAAEIELPMAVPMYTGAQPVKWREKRDVDLDEPRMWRYLTALQSTLVEQLRERFEHVSIQGVEPLQWWEAAEEVIPRAAQLLLGHWSPSPHTRFHLASPKLRLAAARSPD